MNGIKRQGWKREQVADMLVFTILLIVYTGVMYTLFHRQVFGNPNSYHSDMKAYILEMQGLDSGYSFPYPLFFQLGALFHLLIESPEIAIAAALTLLNSLSPLILKYYITKDVESGVREVSARRKLALHIGISLAVFSIFFVSMLFPPEGIYLPGIRNNYVGVFSPNPFHNATYMATRPFAITVFFMLPKLLKEYERDLNWKDAILFALFLLLTTITKPSFTFVLVPTAGIIMAYRLLKGRFRGIIPALKLGACFLPTFAALIYQFFGVFHTGSEGETGIGFGLATAWKLHCDNIVLAIAIALGFPILVLLLNYKELKRDALYLFSWQLLLVSLFEVLFLFEKGFRLPDMNFSWGYMHGLFFAFVGSLMVLIKSTVNGKQHKLFLAGQWLAYFWHFSCGIWYFAGIFRGNLYY